MKYDRKWSKETDDLYTEKNKEKKRNKGEKKEKNVKKLKNKIFIYKYRHATSTLHTWLLPPSWHFHVSAWHNKKKENENREKREKMWKIKQTKRKTEKRKKYIKGRFSAGGTISRAFAQRRKQLTNSSLMVQPKGRSTSSHKRLVNSTSMAQTADPLLYESHNQLTSLFQWLKQLILHRSIKTRQSEKRHNHCFDFVCPWIANQTNVSNV